MWSHTGHTVRYDSACGPLGTPRPGLLLGAGHMHTLCLQHSSLPASRRKANVQQNSLGTGSPSDWLEQRSPTFLAPGTGYVEDSFSTDWGGERMVL